ncbi:hypothetical protein [Eggerthia catenaformis]|uniref:hypothetical protein n=1 Tax=Eggerthia catenaformis TaxID=31973 RepID=UPI00248D4CCC|nr:hypothetical protein [Eggerthia catenaformis]
MIIFVLYIISLIAFIYYTYLLLLDIQKHQNIRNSYILAAVSFTIWVTLIVFIRVTVK